MSKRHDTIFYFGMTSLVILAICVLTAGRWLLWPYGPPMTIKVAPLPVKTKQVVPGEYLVYSSDTCRHVVGPVRLTRTFRSKDDLINLPEHSFVQEEKECLRYDNASVRIPLRTPPGEYVLEITSWHEVNPIREIPIKVQTEKFTVK